jgi:heme exporter protein D
MNFDGLIEISGYGAHVWSAYIICLSILIYNAISAIKSYNTARDAAKN